MDITILKQVAKTDPEFIEWYFILQDDQMRVFTDGSDPEFVNGAIWAYKSLEGISVTEVDITGINMDHCMEPGISGDEQTDRIQAEIDRLKPMIDKEIARMWDEAIHGPDPTDL